MRSLLHLVSPGGKRLLKSLIGVVVPSVGQLPVQVIR
jgi:hypothetical protein